MSYSTIQQKKLICKDCNDGIEKPVIAGRCQYHYKRYLALKSLEKRKVNVLKNDPNNLAIKEENNKLNQWYLDRRKQMSGVCQNCNKKNCKNNDKFWKWSIAHILPKKDNFGGFPSIKTHIENWLELCVDCHTIYDRTWDEASKMPVFKLAKEKFELFKEQIVEEEKRRIPEQLLK